MKIREVADPPSEAAAPGTDIDLFDAYRIQDFADAATFLQGALTENMPASWLPSGVDDAVRRLNRLRGAGRETAAQRLAERFRTDQIPVIAFAAGASPSYLSDRLGCQIFPPYGYGVDLAALCIDETP
jgi:hypothetical protein